jgi:hypothetical protein
MEVDLEMWAEKNAAEFGDKRSLMMTHGIIGFRKGPRTVKARSGLTWEKVVLRLESVFDGIYVRLTPSVDKETILKDEAEGKLPTDKLQEMGVRIVQEDNFYADPKLS